jgi:hypothetical protein
MNKSIARLLYSALAVSAIVGSSFSPFISVANGQSPVVNSNETDAVHNMSKPQLHIGMVTMPVACTSLDEALGSVTGMIGSSSNESQETIMGRMQNMISASGLNATDNNMTEAVVQEALQLKNMTEGVDLLCSLMTEEEMMEEINNTSG